MQQKKYILSDRPVYRQIAEQITANILSCKLRPGQQLQPIRQLSIQYHVNPNTVRHAADDTTASYDTKYQPNGVQFGVT